MQTMSLVISDELVKASGLSEQELLTELVLLLFQQEKIGLGKAAELLGISQVRFQKMMGDRAITIHYDVEELQEDIRTMKAKGWL